jgi:hypothetical protein
MNTYQIVDANGVAITGALTYLEAKRYMQTNRLNRDEYSIEGFMPGRTRETKKESPMYKVVRVSNGEVFYRHYDMSECVTWITDNSDGKPNEYRIEGFTPSNGIAGMSWTD